MRIFHNYVAASLVILHDAGGNTVYRAEEGRLLVSDHDAGLLALDTRLKYGHVL